MWSSWTSTGGPHESERSTSRTSGKRCCDELSRRWHAAPKGRHGAACVLPWGSRLSGVARLGTLFAATCERPSEEAVESGADPEHAWTCGRLLPPERPANGQNQPCHQGEGRYHGSGASDGEGLPAETAL